MKEFKLLDKFNDTIAKGSEDYITNLKRVLEAEPEDISEDDEIVFEYELRNLEFIEPLIILENEL